MTDETRPDREALANALINHTVPSPVSDGTIEMSGVFDWQTLLGIADAVLDALPAPHPEGGTEASAVQLPDGWLRRQCRLSVELLDSLPPKLRASLYFPAAAAPAPTAPTRSCATWPHLECACRGGLSGGASTCTRRREAEREARRVAREGGESE